MKLCIDCRFHSKRAKDDLCKRSTGRFSMVDGHEFTTFNYCESERSSKAKGACSPSAKYFQTNNTTLECIKEYGK